MAQVNPYLAGATGRCPHCGEGMLFDGFLKVGQDLRGLRLRPGRPRDRRRRLDLRDPDRRLPVRLRGAVHDVRLRLAGLAAAAGLAAGTLVACLGLMRPAKGLMVAAHIANNASEAGRHDV
jgi:uncharacterized protein (DUF983 family)